MTDIDIYIEDAGTFTIDGNTWTVCYYGEVTFNVQREAVDNHGGWDVYDDVYYYEGFNPDNVSAEDGDNEIVDGHIHHDAAVAAFKKWIDEGGAGVLEQQATEKGW
jgi:hypothetical protein|tara:strand:+ start:875 stop:1192 length:318 start_codon:yes stop_codon:yes gene_type:complete